MEITTLPAEMLTRVLNCLPPSDQKNAVLVSKRWRDVGEDPSLWTWCRVRVRSNDDIKNLSTKRLKHVQEVQIKYNTDVSLLAAGYLNERILQALILLPRLKKLYFGYNNLSATVDPELLVTVVTKLEYVILNNAMMSRNQIETLFTAMSQKSELKKLDLDGNNLSSIEPELFSSVLTSLEDANLGATKLTNDQLLALFNANLQTSKLKKLNLTKNNLSSVDPELLARWITKMEEFNSFQTNITEPQLTALFRAMSRNTLARLKKLSVFSNNLSDVDPELLAMGAVKLEDVYFTNISKEQTEAIFTAISQNYSHMKKLNLRFINLSSVDPTVLASAVTKLEEVDFRHADLTTEQLASLLKSVQKDTKLKKLLLRGNKTTDLDLGVLRKARENLGDGLDLNVD